MNYNNIIYSFADGIATIKLNRPKVWNAICPELNDEIIDVLKRIRHDQSVRVLIITGGPKVFAAGADIVDMSKASVMKAQRTSAQAQYINNSLEDVPFPVIAAICGPAFGGGCELAISCDFRVVGEHASFAFPEVELGILPGAGGTQRMARIIGLPKAKEMILLGKKIKGPEAAALGLATVLVPDDEVEAEAMRMAEKLKKLPAYASAMAKRSILLGENYGLAVGKNFESELFSLCFGNPDQAEGMAAFIEKRDPEFTNER